MAAQPHYLVVAYPFQGHINPSRGLARHLIRTAGARVTLSTAISAHRLMFPLLSSPDEEFNDGVLTYIPYSDGYDHGFKWYVEDPKAYEEKFQRIGKETLSAILDRLEARGQPVTCIIFTIVMSWAAEVAQEFSIPYALYWIQPATVLAIYYHYFHGYQALIAEHMNEPEFVVTMPDLPAMKIRDLPSLCTSGDITSATIFKFVRRSLDSLELGNKSGNSAKSKVLVNTFEDLEKGALASVKDLNIVPIGPMITGLIADGSNTDAGDIYKEDEKGYMEWLDTKPAKSVVYVSFGSLSSFKKRQLEELKKGLDASGKPYLWVVRKNNREEGLDFENLGEQCMVVEWCNQVQVLSHPSLGCFVTHCGWNSTLEGVACGVPMLALPQWIDQYTNARMIVEWKAGLRGQVDVEGVLESEELKRCLEVIMGEGEVGAEIRRSSEMWMLKAKEAIGEGGSSGRNFKAFLEESTEKSN